VREAEWDPAKHPRGGNPDNTGEFSLGWGPGSSPSGTHSGGAGFQNPATTKPSSGGDKPVAKLTVPPRPAPKLDDPDRRWTLDAAMSKLKLPNVTDPVRQRIRQTLESMYDLGEGTVARELVKDLARQKLPIEIYNGKDPAALPDHRYGFDAAKPAKMFLNLSPSSESFGAEVVMRTHPEEKPPADWRGDVVVLAHELGHVLDELKLTDAKFKNGMVP
jgi:hypothetical protein